MPLTPPDRRRNVMTITQQGRQRLRGLDKLLAAVQDDLLAPLTKSEREQFIDLLTRVLDHQLEKASHR
ncbi:hypothetical protein [Kribbella pratensis]|uniref:hypothetical protein n=1 Tax=Kribbella pratensis TaxID=2512112 RepID=UPI001065D982|nr:hypothetical protein [Kribbella pratensis]